MPTRRKYLELRNYRWVAAKLLEMSPQELADEIGCPASSVHWIIQRYLYPSEREAINYKRVHKKESR